MNAPFSLPRDLHITVDYLEVGASNRPGTALSPGYVTIHNTDNADSGADAMMHAKYMKGVEAQQRQVSWHFTVDDKQCVQSLPTNEQGWHAGKYPGDSTSIGNKTSIGIEICENEGIDHTSANHLAALLTASLLLQLGLDISSVVPHRHWSGKWCPHLLLDTQGSISTFLELVKVELDLLTAKNDLIAFNNSSQCSIAKFPSGWMHGNI